MSKKIILVLLTVWALLSLTGCGATGGRIACDGDCGCECFNLEEYYEEQQEYWDRRYDTGDYGW